MPSPSGSRYPNRHRYNISPSYAAKAATHCQCPGTWILVQERPIRPTSAALASGAARGRAPIRQVVYAPGQTELLCRAPLYATASPAR
jgi:hypothetical protein